MASTFTNFAGANFTGSGSSSVAQGTALALDSPTNATTITADASTDALKLVSGVADGGTAVAHIVDTTNNLATTGAKLWSLRDHGSEVVNFDYQGFLNFPGGAGVKAPSVTTTGTGVVTDTVISNTSVPVTVEGQQADGASAVGVVVRTASAYANATAKLLSVRNNTTEKFAVDKDGKFITQTGIYSGKSGAMTSGAITISTASVTASSLIFLTHAGSGTAANFGTLYVGTVTAGTSFQIKSTNASDNDAVYWWIVN